MVDSYREQMVRLLLSDTGCGEDEINSFLYPDEEKKSITGFTLDHLIHPITNNPIKIAVLNVSTCTFGDDVSENLKLALDAAKSGLYDIVVGPELYLLHENGPLSTEELKHCKSLFKKASKQTLIIPGTIIYQKDGFVSNTAFGFHKGEEVLSYNRFGDATTREIAKEYGLKTKKGILAKEVCTLDYEGLRIGVEICSGSGLLERGGKVGNDIVFLLSSGFPFLFKSLLAVKKGGYAVVVDGNTTYKDCVYKDPFKDVMQKHLKQYIQGLKSYVNLSSNKSS